MTTDQQEQACHIVELLQLPEPFDQFASQVTASIEHQQECVAEQREFIARSDGLVAENTAELRRHSDDVGDLLGHVPGRVEREKSDDIAQMLGFEIVEQLNGDDLRRMVRENYPADITTAERQSFYRADLVAKVEDQQAQGMRKPAQGDP